MRRTGSALHCFLGLAAANVKTCTTRVVQVADQRCNVQVADQRYLHVVQVHFQGHAADFVAAAVRHACHTTRGCGAASSNTECEGPAEGQRHTAGLVRWQSQVLCVSVHTCTCKALHVRLRSQTEHGQQHGAHMRTAQRACPIPSSAPSSCWPWGAAATCVNIGHSLFHPSPKGLAAPTASCTRIDAAITCGGSTAATAALKWCR
jgi:hypothetical protein